ncbi:MAG: hypothetical protein M1829_006173 [Trizodia sp. TS-e1964]|nr:MAG: hypothetical protein M1829_006173 [Trizodia sp. TS-e1964]
MPASDWSNEQWAAEISKKIDSLKADTPPAQPFPEPTSPAAIAQLIDHTLLKPDSTQDQIDQLCDEAKKHGFKSCCVHGSYVQRAAASLTNTPCAVACVVGFPLGACSSPTLTNIRSEAQQAVAAGASELDMVMALGRLKSQDYVAVWRDIAEIKRGVTPTPVLKVIIETALLDDAQIVAACYVAAEAGADYVKTCTGFGGGGATVEHVVLMRKAVSYMGERVKVKASGGVRSLEDALQMVRAGADRIGTSAGLLIMEEAGGGSGKSEGESNNY